MYIDTNNNCSPIHPTPVLTVHGTKDYYDGLSWKGVTYYISLDDVNKYWANYNNTETTPSIIHMPDKYSGDGSTVEHHSYKNVDS